MSSNHERRSRTKNVAAGLIGGLVASWAMEEFQKVVANLSKEMQGADGGGGQQHRQPETEPATYIAAETVVHAATGDHLEEQQKPAAGALVHYAFGGAVGAIYGALAASWRHVTVGAGAPFGAAVWLVADEVGVPLAGLSKSPTEYSASKHAAALAAHLVYGTTTETVRRLLMGVMGD